MTCCVASESKQINLIKVKNIKFLFIDKVDYILAT